MDKFRNSSAFMVIFKEEWEIITKLVRLSAAKAGKDLSRMYLAEKEEIRKK